MAEGNVVNVYKYPATPELSRSNTEVHCTKIVHISDTHMKHDKYLEENLIPDGDILIHSGDFAKYDFTRRFDSSTDLAKEINNIKSFFNKLPHPYKIFVAGNHDTSFPKYNAREIDSLFEDIIYLQDSFVTLNGIKIYGSPWTLSRWFSNATSFSVSGDQIQGFWQAIPEDTDVLVTHTPPQGILDLESLAQWKNLWKQEGQCQICPDNVCHTDPSEPLIKKHCGCPFLRQVVTEKVRPRVHLFGHVHFDSGVLEQDNILFSNAAMSSVANPRPTVINYMNTGHQHTNTDATYMVEPHANWCNLM